VSSVSAGLVGKEALCKSGSPPRCSEHCHGVALSTPTRSGLWVKKIKGKPDAVLTARETYRAYI
jgi:hypothetical protein